MSFGFSVGDFIGAANLAYKLIAALRENHGAGEEYRTAIDELGCYQAALMRVSHLERNKKIPRDTFYAASHMVMQSVDMIQSYLDQTKKYDQKLGRLDSSGFRHGVRKVRWTLMKAEDMRKLREHLQHRNAALQLLLQCAGLEVEDISSKCIDDAKKLERTAVVVKSVDLHDDRVPPSIAQTPNNAFKSQAVVELTGPPPDPNPKSSQLFPLSSFSADQPRASIPDQTSREAEIRTHSSLLRDMLKLGDYQLTENDSTTLMNLLDVLCRPTEKVEPHIPTSVNAPIEFNDAVGRKFSFPWHLCKTWTDMEELIKLAFVHVDIIGPLVHEGSYDLVGPDGGIVLPQAWENIVQPGMAIAMNMWPTPQQPLKEVNMSRFIPPPPFGSDLKMPHLSLYPPGVTTVKSHGSNRSQKKPAPGGFFAWAAGGKGRSGLKKNGIRRDVSVEEVSDSDSWSFESQ